ncbi:MAG: phosphotransferase [Elusimicrobia bacterium]|nr:phosphotransferase [Elusimicrobiota bacterium]
MPAQAEAALHALFERTYGTPAESCALLDPTTGGSPRKLFRLRRDSRSVIGASNADAKENAAFFAFSRHFRSCGLAVPEIYAEDPAKGVYLEEDRFQIEAGRTLDYSPCYPRGSFDRQSMLWDLNYFKYYFLRLGKVAFNEQTLEDDFERLTDFLLEAKRDYFLFRDFQSRNIMVRDGVPWFIDYQGGRRGALQYDLASLCFDAKADLPFEARKDIVETYIAAASAFAPIDRQEFLRYYPGYAFIRIFQAMGAYGLRGFHERKPLFLQSIPYAIRNLEHLLRTSGLPPGLPELEAVLRRLVESSALRKMGQASMELTVRVQSFSYKKGMPVDDTSHGGGFVFDCRALPNPGREEKYAKLTGKDAAVVEFLDKEPAVGRFLEHVYSMADQSVENYKSRNFTDLLIAFGCTGGRHRSVYCAERLAERLRDTQRVRVEIVHRDGEPEES